MLYCCIDTCSQGGILAAVILMFCVLSFSMATATEKHENRSQGRPKKSLLPSLLVTVEGKELAPSFSKSNEQHAPAMLCLSVPHRLLQQWRQQAKAPKDYIPLLNQSIVGEAVTIKKDCDSVGARYIIYPLNKDCINCLLCRLDGCARRLHSEASRLCGSKLTQLMNRSFYLAIYPGESFA